MNLNVLIFLLANFLFFFKIKKFSSNEKSEENSATFLRLCMDVVPRDAIDISLSLNVGQSQVFAAEKVSPDHTPPSTPTRGSIIFGTLS